MPVGWHYCQNVPVNLDVGETMKRRKADHRRKMLIAVNTWLFGMGAMLVAYNAYIALPEGGAVNAYLVGDISQREAVTLSSFAMMLAGFFYSLVILKPELLRRSRQMKLITLDLDGQGREEFLDKMTHLPNRAYFDKAIDFYLEECAAIDEIVGVFAIRVRCNHECYVEAMRLVSKRIRDAARDSDLVARVDTSTFAIIMPHMKKADFPLIAERFQSALGQPQPKPFMYTCKIGFAASGRKAKTKEVIMGDLEANLQQSQHLNETVFVAA